MATVKNKWIGFLDRSYQQIKTSLLNRVTSSNPEMTDHSESNPFVIIISMFAGIAEMLGYYIDNAAEESFMATATRKTSVIKHSTGYDYRIKARSPESVDIKIVWDQPVPSQFTISAGSEITSNNNIVYYMLSDFVVAASVTESIIPFEQVSIVSISPGNTDGSKNQKINLGTKYAQGTLVLSVNSVELTEVESFALYGPTDDVYIIDIDVNGNAYAVLGNGIYGSLPNSGLTIQLDYKETNGESDRVQAGEFNDSTLVLDATLPGTLAVSSANSQLNSSGGSDYEELESIRTNSINKLSSLGRMVTRDDYRNIIKSLAGVFDAGIQFDCGNNTPQLEYYDGIIWPSADDTYDWTDVAYGDGLWMAVANDGADRVMISTNGATWSLEGSILSGANYSAIFFANSLMMIAGTDGGDVYIEVYDIGTSTWITTGTIPGLTESVNGITYMTNVSKWILVTDTKVYYSGDDGASWTDTGYSGDQLNSVNFGANRAIVIGDGGRIGVSTDGITWVDKLGVADRFWNSVAYGNGLYVAVANDIPDGSTAGRIMTSLDGTNWHPIDSPNDYGWNSVCYGNGLFVAVAISGTGTDKVMTSVDGITWVLRTATNNYSWTSVIYGNGLFVAVADAPGTTDSVMTSVDGITWTSRTSIDARWHGVTYGNGLYVAVSWSVTVMTSPDGINWTSRTGASNDNWQGVTYGNGLYVAVANTFAGGSNGRVMTSPDGINWTSRDASAANSWVGVTYGNGLYVAVAIDGSGDRVMTSPDGITWTSRINPVAAQYRGIIYGNGLFVAVGWAGTVNERVMTSSDGVGWVGTILANAGKLQDIVYGNGLFIVVSSNALGSGGNYKVLTSTSGDIWTERAAANNNSWAAVAYGNGLFVAVADGGTNPTKFVMTSPDGITWVERTSEEDNEWVGIIFGNDKYIAVATTGTNRVMQIGIVGFDQLKLAKEIGIFIIPEGGGEAPSSLIALAQAEADDKKTITTWPKVLTAGVTKVNIILTVIANKRQIVSDVEDDVNNALIGFFDYSNQGVNPELKLSNVQALVDNLDSVDSMIINGLYVKPYARLLVGSNPLVWTINTQLGYTGNDDILIQYLGGTFRVFKNSVLHGVGIDDVEYTLDANFKFTIDSSGGYEAGDVWKFITQPYLENINLTDYSVFSITLADIDLTVKLQN